MKKAFIAAVAAITIALGSLAPMQRADAQSTYLWWIVYGTQGCSGTGVIVYHYATLLYLYSQGQVVSYRKVQQGLTVGGCLSDITAAEVTH